MTNYIDNYAESTRQILKDGIGEQDDFVSLAIAGEQLRRAASVGEPSPQALDLLHEYQLFLAAYEGEVLDDLAGLVRESLGDLQAYCNQLSERNIARGEELLTELDELVSLAVAGARAGIVEISTPEELGDLILSSLSELSSSLCGLGQFAEDREILFGADLEFPKAFAWWDTIAQLAPSRIALRVTVNAAARKERIIEAAIASFAAKHEPSTLSSLVKRVRNSLDTLGSGLRLTMPVLAQQASYSDDVCIPSAQIKLFEFGGFAIFQDNKYLVFIVMGEHTLTPVTVGISGALLEAEVIDESTFRVLLPSFVGTTLQVVVRLDGEELVLPPISYDKPL